MTVPRDPPSAPGRAADLRALHLLCLFGLLFLVVLTLAHSLRSSAVRFTSGEVQEQIEHRLLEEIQGR